MHDDWFKRYKSGRLFIGVDWAKGAGMIRGEVIKKDDGVTHVRFRTVDALEIEASMTTNSAAENAAEGGME